MLWTPTRLSFFFICLNRRTNQRLCFNCCNYELVWNGNKCGDGDLGNTWVVRWVSDLQPLWIYWCNSISKHRFIDILHHFWGTCHPSIIDRGEHPTINISLGHSTILRASWERRAIMYSESISLVVDYLCVGPLKPKARCVHEVLLLRSRQ